jgi:hypothetical protein
LKVARELTEATQARAILREVRKEITSYIQAQKVDISREVVGAYQLAELFPEEYVAYHTSKNRRNLYADPERFYGWMLKSPKLWSRNFIFVGGEEEASTRIYEAVNFAWSLARQKYAAYGVNKTGFLRDRLMLGFEGALRNNPSSTKDEVTSDSIYEVMNITAYAAAAEVHAKYVLKQQGILYYVALQTANRFPDVGVRFVYNLYSEVRGRYGREVRDKRKVRKYDTPTIRIGSPQNVSGPHSQPGTNLRRRARSDRLKRARVARINKKYGGQ